MRREGEAYRRQLWQLVKERGLQQHVEFVDQYLSQAQIVEYLLASDVYVTPYLDPQQVTSGTLAYALGAGKAIVSTPYPHATEVLTGERGLLVPFRSPSALAEATLRILGRPGAEASVRTGGVCLWARDSLAARRRAHAARPPSGGSAAVRGGCRMRQDAAGQDQPGQKSQQRSPGAGEFD